MKTDENGIIDFSQFKKEPEKEENEKVTVEEEEKVVKKMTIHYEDGTKKTIQKGFVGYLEDENIAVEFAQTSGNDLTKMSKLGLMAFSHFMKSYQ